MGTYPYQKRKMRPYYIEFPFFKRRKSVMDGAREIIRVALVGIEAKSPYVHD